MFRGFVHDVLEGINEPLEVRFEGMQGLFGYLSAQIDDHLRSPRDDLTSYLINAEIDGVKLDAPHVIGSMALLLLAGIDTTWSAVGASIWHLAKTPADRERLVAEPDVLPVAMGGEPAPHCASSASVPTRSPSRGTTTACRFG